MQTVEDREAIRRAFFIEEKSIREIARELHHSRKTIRKALASAEAETYTLTESRPAPVLGPYKARIDELLEENTTLPRKQRYTGERICAILEGEGYTGSRSTVRTYLAAQRKAQRRPQVYLPLEYDPGTDAQVDWGEGVAEIAGERVTVQLFYMRLSYSRRMFMMAFPTQRQEAFLMGHVKAFAFFGGYMRNRQVLDRWLDNDHHLEYATFTQRKRGKAVVLAMVFSRFHIVEGTWLPEADGHSKASSLDTESCPTSLPRAAVA